MNAVWIWVVPDPESFVSGGNRYNANLMAALQERGDQVLRISPDEVKSQTNIDPKTIWIWDSMYLDLYEKEGNELPGKAGVVLHFLPSEKRLLLTKCTTMADFLIIPGEGYRSLLTSLGVVDDKILTLIPGYETIPVLSQRTRKGPLKWISVANLVPEKGLLDFLNSTIWKASPHLIPHLDIFGDDRLDVSYAKAITDMLNTPPWIVKVYYKGHLLPSDLWSLLEEYDAFLTTSPHESYGMAVRESLQTGLPVFGLAGGHLAQLVDQPEKGILFDDLHLLCGFLASTEENEFRQQWPIPIPEEFRPHGPNWQQQASALQAKAMQLWGREKE